MAAIVSKVYTASLEGVTGYAVTVETDMSPGLPATNMVGLASTTVMEARERVKSAISNSGYEYPMRRITINLTPAGLRKTGTHFDLPIAVGVLCSSRYVRCIEDRCLKYAVIGELALDGKVLAVDGVLPMVQCLQRTGVKRIILPSDNSKEAMLIADSDVEIYGVRTLRECVDIINGIDAVPLEHIEMPEAVNIEMLDFSDIKGQESAKRALTVAAAGEHGLIMLGNPGCGKTMLAKRLPGILPVMTRSEILDTTVIYSAMGQLDSEQGAILERPFRMPHHTIKRASLVGGGLIPVPGEISLAHNGVLFLDEVGEFDRTALEALRIPIEDGKITLSRRGHLYEFPSRFMLLMASNPCKCGYYGDPDHECKCSMADLESYRRKLSGPIVERVDMQIYMEKVSYDQMAGEDGSSISSEEMRQDVNRARKYALSDGRAVPNGKMADQEAVKSARLGREENEFMERAYKMYSLSPRTYVKVIKVARTIADIDESERVTAVHLSEALSYRTALDRIHV